MVSLGADWLHVDVMVRPAGDAAALSSCPPSPCLPGAQCSQLPAQ